MTQAKPIHVAQYRLGGPTAGFRVLRPVQGPHRWRIRIWLKFPDGGDSERDILVRQPCILHALAPVYEREIFDLCRTSSGEDVIVRAGGLDVHLLPEGWKEPPPKPLPPDRFVICTQLQPHVAYFNEPLEDDEIGLQQTDVLLWATTFATRALANQRAMQLALEYPGREFTVRTANGQPVDAPCSASEPISTAQETHEVHNP